jgi:peptidyl-tRNA hydrolase, PTH1 family
MRIGIGENFSRGRQVEYVLSRFNKEEMEELPFIFNQTTEAVLSFVSIGLERTMNEYNKK